MIRVCDVGGEGNRVWSVVAAQEGTVKVTTFGEREMALAVSCDRTLKVAATPAESCFTIEGNLSRA